MPCCNPRPALSPTNPLIQIRRGFSTRCNGLLLTVALGVEEWTAEVQDPTTNRTLYTAQRWNAEAAKNAVIEFATFAAGDNQRPVDWTPFW